MRAILDPVGDEKPASHAEAIVETNQMEKNHYFYFVLNMLLCHE